MNSELNFREIGLQGFLSNCTEYFYRLMTDHFKSQKDWTWLLMWEMNYCLTILSYLAVVWDTVTTIGFKGRGLLLLTSSGWCSRQWFNPRDRTRPSPAPFHTYGLEMPLPLSDWEAGEDPVYLTHNSFLPFTAFRAYKTLGFGWFGGVVYFWPTHLEMAHIQGPALYRWPKSARGLRCLQERHEETAEEKWKIQTLRSNSPPAVWRKISGSHGEPFSTPRPPAWWGSFAAPNA